jgi:hypothetical protein
MYRFSFALHLITIPLFFFNTMVQTGGKRAVSPALAMHRCMAPKKDILPEKLSSTL